MRPTLDYRRPDTKKVGPSAYEIAVTAAGGGVVLLLLALAGAALYFLFVSLGDIR